MNGKESKSSMARRWFLSRLGTGVGVVGATAIGSASLVAQTASDSPWRPARHKQDEWYNRIPGEHRFVFDTTSADSMGLALRFANNYFKANLQGYGLKDSDLAVIIIARHKSTAFAYNDAIWAKYGKILSAQAQFTDPKTKHPPTVNVYLKSSKDKGKDEANQIDTLLAKGVHFAVCEMATKGISGRIAKATGSSTDSVYKEITANLVGNSHLVPAGIVAVNRAQEYGYSYVYGI